MHSVNYLISASPPGPVPKELAVRSGHFPCFELWHHVSIHTLFRRRFPRLCRRAHVNAWLAHRASSERLKAFVQYFGIPTVFRRKEARFHTIACRGVAAAHGASRQPAELVRALKDDAKSQTSFGTRTCLCTTYLFPLMPFHLRQYPVGIFFCRLSKAVRKLAH